ncbi:MAG: MFS transporter [Betaproteobacteria bacterium]|nr:MFS transporter [Betaproteobacteria bacterium]
MINENQSGLKLGWPDVGAVLCALFAYSLLETMIAPAMPLFQEVYGASAMELGLVMASLLLVGAVSMPLVGRLGDLYDKKLVLVGTLAITSVGIVIAACSRNITELAIGQALQGFAFGIMPVAVGLMNEGLEPRKAAIANGLIVGVAALSTATGLVISGPLIELGGLQAIYWMPLAMIVSSIAFFMMHKGVSIEIKNDPNIDKSNVDWVGSISLALLLGLLLVGLGGAATKGWTSLGTVGPIIAFLALLPIWIKYEQRVVSPILDTRLLKLRGVREMCLVVVSVGFGSAATYSLLPMILNADPAAGIGFGANTTSIGLHMLPLGLAALVVGPLVDRFNRWWGERAVVCLGALLTSLGAIMPAIFNSQSWQLAFGAGILGAGAGITLTAAINTVVRAVPANRAASTFAAVMLLRTFGAMLGTQLCMTVLSTGIRSVSTENISAKFTDAFLLAAAGCLLALIAGSRYPKSLPTSPAQL